MTIIFLFIIFYFLPVLLSHWRTGCVCVCVCWLFNTTTNSSTINRVNMFFIDVNACQAIITTKCRSVQMSIQRCVSIHKCADFFCRILHDVIVFQYRILKWNWTQKMRCKVLNRLKLKVIKNQFLEKIVSKITTYNKKSFCPFNCRLLKSVIKMFSPMRNTSSN